MAAFIHQLTSGMAGWLTFEQMRKGVDNLREAELAKPIEEISKGRGFEVKGEFPLPTPPNTRGTPPRLDFLLVNRTTKHVIAIETKYKKAGKKMGGSLAADAARLNELTIEAINEQIKQKRGGVIRDTVEGYELVRAVLVVWHETDILDQINLEPVPIRNQFLRLVKALLPEGKEATFDNLGEAMVGIIATKPVARKFGSLRSGSTVTYKRFWVASFLHQQNWATLQARG